MRACEKLEPGRWISAAAQQANEFSGKRRGDDHPAWPWQSPLADLWPEYGNFFFMACDLAAMEARHKLRGLATNF